MSPSISSTDFTNVLSKAQIERLAEADEHELVREVQVGAQSSCASEDKH